MNSQNQESTEKIDPVTIRKNIEELLNSLVLINQNQIKTSSILESTLFELHSIPFIPIEMNFFEMNMVWSIVGDLLFNLEGGILVFLTDTHLVPEELYFLKLAENGNIVQIQNIALNEIPVQIQGNINLEEQYDRLKSWIKTQHNAELGNLLLISNQFVDELITIYLNYTKNDQSRDYITLILKYLEKLSQAQASNNVVMFPTPRILHFLHSLSQTIINIQTEAIIQTIKYLLPDLQATVSFQVDQNYIPYKVINKQGNMTWNRIELNNETMKNLEPVKHRKIWLKTIRKQEHCSQNLVVDLTIHQLFADILESDYPLSPNRFKLLLQKGLYGYKSRGDLWDLDPSPLIYYPAFRFIAYTFGYRINLNKISHWSIPETLETYVSKVFGMNSNFVLLIGDELNSSSFSKNQFNKIIQLYAIKIENRSIKTIKGLSSDLFKIFIENYDWNEQISKVDIKKVSKKNPIPSQNEINTHLLTEFRIYLCQNLEYINSIFFIKKKFLHTLLQELNCELFGRRFPPMLKLKKLQKEIREGSLSIIPQNNFFSQGDFKQSEENLKLLIALFTDQREY